MSCCSTRLCSGGGEARSRRRFITSCGRGRRCITRCRCWLVSLMPRRLRLFTNYIPLCYTDMFSYCASSFQTDLCFFGADFFILDGIAGSCYHWRDQLCASGLPVSPSTASTCTVFEIWLATTVIFLGLGNLAFSLLEYRLGQRDLVCCLSDSVLTAAYVRLYRSSNRSGITSNGYLSCECFARTTIPSRPTR